MPKKKTRDELTLQIEKTKKRIKYKKQRIKIMEHKLSQEMRRERTHRLCNHGADLEVYLKPEVFTDEQIRKILKDIFALPEVQKIVAEIAAPEDAPKVHFEEMRNYTP